MANNNASNQDYSNAADGFTLAGGTSKRTLTVTGANITLTGSGTNVYTYPAATDTLVGRASTDTLTNKDLTSATNVFPAGSLVQSVNVASSAVATGTTIMPADDTIPQQTEGDQYMSLAITPKSATNSLVIQVVFMFANSTVQIISGALFQDATANAIAATGSTAFLTGAPNIMTLTHKMTAGTTSATTFKFRAGTQSTGTLTFNGVAAGRYYGGVGTISSITIWEYKS